MAVKKEYFHTYPKKYIPYKMCFTCIHKLGLKRSGPKSLTCILFFIVII